MAQIKTFILVSLDAVVKQYYSITKLRAVYDHLLTAIIIVILIRLNCTVVYFRKNPRSFENTVYTGNNYRQDP
jgi:hypothetical protein